MEAAFAGLSGVQLIETLGWDGAAFVRLDRHLDRLMHSAERLGFACDRAAALAALRSGAHEGRPARMRLLLDAKGRVEVTAAALPAARAEWRLGLAAARLTSDDPWLTLKSTRRAVYDEARAALPEGVEELVFLNERGEVCDGTITTLFFDAGGGMRTPPLSCGLLPGVLRAELLAQAGVQEAKLSVADLGHVRLWVGNSLRGLIPAVWAG
jgi:4-amino-4-deoxychorismate lyase